LTRQEVDTTDREISGDDAFKKEWADWSHNNGAAGKLKKRRFGQTIGEDLD
jgi:hypothetical protein